MINIIFQFLALTRILFTFSLFTYIYKYFYDSCNEKKVIKIKKDKPKKVIKTRIGLSFIYFIILILLYFSLNWYVFISFMLSVLITIVMIAHKFDPVSINLLKKYDSLPIVKRVWFFYSRTMNLIFKIFSPFHRIIENKINNNKKFIKEILFGQMGKINLDNNIGLFNAFSELSASKTVKSNKNIFDSIETFFLNNKSDKSEKIIKSDKSDKNDKNNKSDKSDKNKTTGQTSDSNKNITDREKSNAKIIIDDIDSITEFEEPLDSVLLKKNKTSNKENDDINEFISKIKSYKNKVNKSKIVMIDSDNTATIKSKDDINNEDLSNFIVNNNVFSLDNSESSD